MDFTDDTDRRVLGPETPIAPFPHPCYPWHPWSNASSAPWAASRRASLHPNLPLLASLFHLCESVRICGRDPRLESA